MPKNIAQDRAPKGPRQRSEFRLVPHPERVLETMIEVWYAGELVAHVTTTRGPGVAVISTRTLVVVDRFKGKGGVTVLTEETRRKTE